MTHAVYPSLAGKTVVITGGGSGIGEVIVEGFVRQKAKVYFLDVAESESRALVTRLADGARFVKCDVTDVKALQAALADIEKSAGAISVLVNNAANDDRHKIDEVTPEYWENRIAVNLRHLFFAAQAVSAGMKKAGGGSIINLGSVSWHSAIDNLSVYETAKAGIEGMTRAMARDLGESNIRVNCVTPAAVRTAIFDQMTQQHIDFMLSKIPMGRFGTVEEIASLVCWLASEECSFTTGAAFDCSGGRATY